MAQLNHTHQVEPLGRVGFTRQLTADAVAIHYS